MNQCVTAADSLKPVGGLNGYTNPPFGGKEGTDAQQHFPFKTGATQVLFVQAILHELAPAGTCGIVLDEGLLFRTNEGAFVETKRKLTDECAVWAIVSLPGGVFSTAGAGVKTNLVFFTRGQPTTRIWYYDLSWVKVGKKTPLTLAHFGFDRDGGVLPDTGLPATLTADWPADPVGAPFPSYARLLPDRGTPAADGPWSWTLDFTARREEARARMEPLLADADSHREALTSLRERLRRLKQTGAEAPALAAVTAAIRDEERAIRDLEAQAAAIDAAVYDLKAVNPHARATADTRTPAEIIAGIEAQGQIVAEALARLRALLAS